MTMEKILTTRDQIYDQFHGSRAIQDYFFLLEHADRYAAYYTSMYLVQDTGEAIYTHMSHNFSSSPMAAYIEFWGVMQAVVIQQDAIQEILKAVTGNSTSTGTAWKALRDIRNLCAGHPSNRSQGVPAPQRAFMGRHFGNYESVQYELWDAKTRKTSHPVFNLRQMISDYDTEGSAALLIALNFMKANWP